MYGGVGCIRSTREHLNFPDFRPMQIIIGPARHPVAPSAPRRTYNARLNWRPARGPIQDDS